MDPTRQLSVKISFAEKKNRRQMKSASFQSMSRGSFVGTRVRPNSIAAPHVFVSAYSMPPKSRKRPSEASAAPVKRGKSAGADAKSKSKPKKDAAADKSTSKSKSKDADAADSLRLFETWCRQRGFVLHPSLELRDVTPDGQTRVSTAAFARNPVKINDVLCEIPKEWCLTPQTGSISLAVPIHDLDDLDDAALIFAVMYEKALRESSAWWPYFNRLPFDHEPLPFLWDTSDQAELRGTEVSFRVEDDLRAMREDHGRVVRLCREHVAKLGVLFPDGTVPDSTEKRKVTKKKDEKKPKETKATKREDSDDSADDSHDDSDSDSQSDSQSDSLTYEHDHGPCGFRAFLSAASLVASRAFHVDDTAGQGLAPVADLFNHRGGGGEHVHFEENDDDDDDVPGDEKDDDENDDDVFSQDDSENFEQNVTDSDDENVEAELTRLRGENELGETTFDEFERAVDSEQAKPAGGVESDSEGVFHADSDSDDADVEAELKRLRGKKEKGETTFDEFERAVENEEAKEVGDVEAGTREIDGVTKEVSTVIAGSSSLKTLRLIAVNCAKKGDELFNTFGEHGNSALLHKYGFCETDNALGCGGVTVPVDLLIELLGNPLVYYEAFAALEGGFIDEEDFTEEETTEDENGDEIDDDDDDVKNKNGKKDDDDAKKHNGGAPWETLTDAVSPGAAIAAAAGWCGGVYEISDNGTVSRDLLLLFATALADPDDGSHEMDGKTGLPTGLETVKHDDDVLVLPGVAEATLAAIKARLSLLPVGTVQGDLKKAKQLQAKCMSKQSENGSSVPKHGVTGIAAALVLRANERLTLEKAFEGLVEKLTRLTACRGDAKKVSKPTKVSRKKR